MGAANRGEAIAVPPTRQKVTKKEHKLTMIFIRKILRGLKILNLTQNLPREARRSHLIPGTDSGRSAASAALGRFRMWQRHLQPGPGYIAANPKPGPVY